MKKITYYIGIFALILISSLTIQVKAQNIGSLKNVVSPGFSFTLDLQPGDTDPQVLQLQRVLNADVDTTVALEGDGSSGRETTHFGDATKQAVIKFQNKYRDTILTPSGLTQGTGNVGQATRTRLNLLIGVMNTYPSVGAPQSRASNASTNSSAVTYIPISSNSSSGMNTNTSQAGISICQFIQLLGSIGLLSSNQINQDLNSFSCQTQNTGDLTPSVTVKVNGSKGPISVDAGTSVTASWTSDNVTSCSGGSGTNYPTSGSLSVVINSSPTQFSLTCTGSYGTVKSNSVVVNINSANNNLNVSTTSPFATNDYSFLLPNYSSTTNKVLLSAGKPGDMVSIKNSASLIINSQITLEAWVNPTSWATVDSTTHRSDNVIISKGEIGSGGSLVYALSLDNGKLGFSNNTGGLYTCSAVVPLNSWTHVAATVDENIGQVKLYVNGKEITSVCQGTSGNLNKFNAINEIGIAPSFTSPNISASTSTVNLDNVHIANFYNVTPCSIASSTDTVNNGFIGKIDDVRIWNIARTAVNIASSTNKSVSTSTGLVAEYTFDNGTTNDSTNFSNNGFIKGSISIVTDNTSPAAANSLNSALAYSSSLSFLYADPDGVCQAPTVEPPTTEDSNAPTISFGGVVVSVGKCSTSRPYTSGTLWQVAIKACKSGDVVSTPTGLMTDGSAAPAGASSNPRMSGASTDPGYIVIRSDVQSNIPKVGDIVLGKAVPDSAMSCTNATGGDYIGTVTGPLGAGSDTLGCTDTSSNNSYLGKCGMGGQGYGAPTMVCEDNIGQHWTISPTGTIKAIGADYGIVPVLPTGTNSWLDFYKSGGNTGPVPTNTTTSSTQGI